MGKRKIALVVWLAAILCSLILGFLFAIRPKISHDPFAFLEERKPFLTGADRQIGGTQDLFEYRIYSWRGDFATVAKVAEEELSKLGYVSVYNSKTGRGWKIDGGLMIWVDQGYSWTRRQAFQGKGREAGVTVVIGGPIEEDWNAKLRAWIEPRN